MNTKTVKEVLLKVIDGKCHGKSKTKEHPEPCSSTKTSIYQADNGFRNYKCEKGHEWFYI